MKSSAGGAAFPVCWAAGRLASPRPAAAAAAAGAADRGVQWWGWRGGRLVNPSCAFLIYRNGRSGGGRRRPPTTASP